MSTDAPTERELRPLGLDLYRRGAEEVARELLGRYLVRSVGGRRRAVVKIVETEAYLGEIDAASHAAGGRRTARTETMYRAGGIAYVYLIYGIYHCLNVVTGPAERASAVLVRAVEAIEGVDWMAENRGARPPLAPGQLGGGPGKLSMALAIDRSHDGAPLDRGELVLSEGRPVEASGIARGPRIGVDYAGEAAAWPLRFGIAGHREMSRPRLG